MAYTKSRTVGNQIHGGGTASVEVHGEDEFLKHLNDLIYSRKELSEIVESAVPMVEEHLRENTPYDEDEDVTNKKLYGVSIGHIRDGITHKPNQYPDGGTDIGFTYQTAPIARWTNWGTYRQKPQFWFEKAFDTLPFDEIFAKESETAKMIAKRKGLL